ncbi:DUF3006 family protein [Salinilacihabitans rarus]|uniref:DUF3006 family protein n=1 Tax=Salinilacihabitans rarus TaxID=2961596 RepID=UPI0020C86CF3|nr:DUF3006 family protein [Salinilacihabitans rarus]
MSEFDPDADGPVTAVLDRIVDGETAVLLLEAEGRVVDERTLPAADLPADGRREGAVFEVVVEDGEVVEATYLPETTRERRESARDRFDRLSERLGEE